MLHIVTRSNGKIDCTEWACIGFMSAPRESYKEVAIFYTIPDAYTEAFDLLIEEVEEAFPWVHTLSTDKDIKEYLQDKVTDKTEISINLWNKEKKTLGKYFDIENRKLYVQIYDMTHEDFESRPIWRTTLIGGLSFCRTFYEDCVFDNGVTGDNDNDEYVKLLRIRELVRIHNLLNKHKIEHKIFHIICYLEFYSYTRKNSHTLFHRNDFFLNSKILEFNLKDFRKTLLVSSQVTETIQKLTIKCYSCIDIFKPYFEPLSYNRDYDNVGWLHNYYNGDTYTIPKDDFILKFFKGEIISEIVETTVKPSVKKLSNFF